jgi:hypothetical protein
LNDPQLRRVRPGHPTAFFRVILVAHPLTISQAYDVHRRPLPQQTPTRADSRASTLSKTTTSVPTSTQTSTPTRASTPPQAHNLISPRTERPGPGTTAVLERLEKVHERQMKERLEWARKCEERRLDKLKGCAASQEIQNLGQKQAALVGRMVQDLFALTPEWEVRRTKARAVSIPVSSRSLSLTTLDSSSVQSEPRQREGALEQPLGYKKARIE